ncbi:hypothetical protein DPMN_154808 [Dreissena polymorpha]|uniref:Uncharacterized protein n=1 Tax=Dreissena polymorpha TaxID=45954 RepID=A0A9D4FMR1_DREPO|nr:hypothetical protein DPMN_154808 [Dreissena polymorpha]
MAVSSAKRRTWDVIREGRSVIYKRKRRGPRTDPCGTPEVIGTWSDIEPSNTTDGICQLGKTGSRIWSGQKHHVP